MSQIFTVQNAPRDAADLTGLGVFMHRRLADELQSLGFSLWTKESEKGALLAASPGERAAAIAQKLKEFDASRGGAPAPAAAPAADSAAVPSLTPAPTGRRPRTASQAASNAQETPPAAAQQAAGGSSNVVDLLATIKALRDMVVANHDRIEQMIATQEAQAKSLAILISASTDVKAKLHTAEQIRQVSLGTLMLFGQQVLQGATIDDILPTAIQDANTVLEKLDGLGKA